MEDWLDPVKIRPSRLHFQGHGMRDFATTFRHVRQQGIASTLELLNRV